MTQKRAQLAVVGECMLEFSEQASNQFTLSFAGDTYNMAVYCQRCADPDRVQVEYITAVGDDLYSDRMLARWREEHIGTHWVRRLANQNAGAYLISTDSHGERSFQYYRSDSAARELFDGSAGEATAAALLSFDYLYLSGITLAILLASGRELLLETLAKAKARGVMICFDNNYRPILWDSDSEARAVVNRVLPYVDIFLPSFDDARALFLDSSVEACAERALEAGVGEIVIKQGEQGYWLINAGGSVHYPVSQVVNIVDTTAAGDSFNGAYLAARMQGVAPEVAAAEAARVAAYVVTCRGAIVPREQWLAERGG